MKVGGCMKKYGKYIFVFVLFLALLFLVPLAGDDWGNYLTSSKGVLYGVRHAFDLYFSWEGRFMSRLVVNLLGANKWIWNIINSLLITVTVYLSMKFINGKTNKMIFPLVVLMFLLMNIYTFSEVISWFTGNVVYFFIIPVLLWYFYYLLNNDEYGKKVTFLFIVINFFGTMFVENMAVVLVFANILLLIYKYIKNKKIDKKLFVCLVVSICTMLLMLLSPGTAFRGGFENADFNKLNIFQKVIRNIPNFINYTFIINPYLLVLLSFSNYFIIRKHIKNSVLKYGLIVFMLIVPLFSIIVYPVSLFMNTKLDFFIDSTNLFIVIYWLLYLVVMFCLLIIDGKKNLENILMFLVGLVSNLSMLMSPIWGFRTSFFTYLFLCIVALCVINNYLQEIKMFDRLAWCLVLMCSLFYLVFYINVYRCQINLERSIKKQIKDDSNIIYVESFPGFAGCNINPINDFHKELYKQYYEIPSDKELVITEGNWKYIIFYRG